MELHRQLLAHFKPEETAELIRLLEKARQLCEENAGQTAQASIRPEER